MGLLVGKAQVLIHKEPNIACLVLSSSFAHKPLLVFVCAILFQHDSVCVRHLAQQIFRGELYLVQLDRNTMKINQSCDVWACIKQAGCSMLMFDVTSFGCVLPCAVQAVCSALAEELKV